MSNSKSFLIFFVLSIALYFLSSKIFPKSSVSPNVPTIKAPAGQIKGTELKTKYGRSISAYRVIPYADPPIGDLRFKKPKLRLENAWEGVFDGSGKITPCVQPNFVKFWNPLLGSEDCLHLNVYVPQTKEIPSDGFSVMVWIHGGGFFLGDSSEAFHGPGNLLDKDVIFVSLNYRLGVFGFLTLGDEFLPGNLGLWDQLGGLKWVKRNIAAFGGNTNKITIFGESAGGMSISSHLASHQSKGHFSAAIVQSGSMDMPMLNIEKIKALPGLHQKYVNQLNCSINTSDMLPTVKCLQTKSVDELMSNVNLFDECSTSGVEGVPFTLVWIPYDDHILKDSFFGDDPRKVFEDGTFNVVPTMIGLTKDEGILTSSWFYNNPERFREFWNDKLCPANHFLGHSSFGNEEMSDEIETKVNAIKQQYFGGDVETFDDSVFKNLSNAYTDSGFHIGTDILVRQLASKTKTYYYHFDHLGSVSLADILVDKLFILKKMIGYHSTNGLGVCHGDEIFHLFRSTEMSLMQEDNVRDQKMVDFMVDKWTNFAIHHNPTPIDNAWPAYGDNGISYVRLEDSKIITQNDKVRDERLEFWRQIHSS